MFAWCSAPDSDHEDIKKVTKTSRRRSSAANRDVRTAKDEVVPASRALQMLREGNRRFMAGNPEGPHACSSLEQARQALATAGQSPMAAVIGCADSRCPVEILFDALPGDIFVCRNAGNTCTHAEGSMVGSLEFCVGALRTKLILVLGHTSCGAIKGATSAYLDSKKEAAKAKGKSSALEKLLEDLQHVAEKAEAALPANSSLEDIAEHAVRVNVFQTMEFLLQYSKPIREKVMAGEVEVHGAVYHLETGEVEFLGRSPMQGKLYEAQTTLPPSMMVAPSVDFGAGQRALPHMAGSPHQAASPTAYVPPAQSFPSPMAGVSYGASPVRHAGSPVASAAHAPPAQSFKAPGQVQVRGY